MSQGEEWKWRARNAEKAIDSTNDGYWVLDADGAFVDVNPGYCRMMGYSREEVLAMCIADFEAAATMPQIKAQILRIIQQGHERFETRHRQRDGNWIDLEITVTVVDQRYLVACSSFPRRRPISPGASKRDLH